MVSSTCAVSTLARSSAAFVATTPMSAAVIPASVPPNFPIGVRAPERIKTSFTNCSSPREITFQFTSRHLIPAERIRLMNSLRVLRVSVVKFLRLHWQLATGNWQLATGNFSLNTVYGIHSVEETLKSRPKGVHYVAMARERNDIKLQRI